MMLTDLLKTSKWMALSAIGFCFAATLIAFFSIDFLEIVMFPFLVSGILLWVLSVIWFLWGWLKNANEDGNEKKGISASSYILAFLPLCYCFLMATDEARTKIRVEITNEFKPIHSVSIYGSGTIFLKQDTLKLAGLALNESADFSIKATTAPNKKGAIYIECFFVAEKFKKQIAGPFSIIPMNIVTRWDVVIDQYFLDSNSIKTM